MRRTLQMLLILCFQFMLAYITTVVMLMCDCDFKRTPLHTRVDVLF
jgi:hypothetical protein